MNASFDEARTLISSWKGDSYVFGRGRMERLGPMVRAYGKKALVVCNGTYMKSVSDAVVASLRAAGVEISGGVVAPDAGPNAPREDVYRLEGYILHLKPDCIVAVGGGSTIDACKAANVLASIRTRSPEIDLYFGSNLVTQALADTDSKLLPLVAVQTSASSGAHLTKYSNITDPMAGQKKLIVDDAIIPSKSLFDYDVTLSMPVGVTIDGALDAIAHVFEVFAGINADNFDLAAKITEVATELVLEYAPAVIKNPEDRDAREAIGMATDLGGYAIMVGGTNGAHLTSFSLVDVTSHGKACGIMNPYYLIFFSPKIERQLRIFGEIFKKHGYVREELSALSGRELGLAVARGMVSFGKAIGAPTKLNDLQGFDEEKHVKRALDAAKNPQLEMKLKNMPVPLTAALVDEYMEPILRAASIGDFSLIKLMK
jgi:alcohol dehydrogenase class IV